MFIAKMLQLSFYAPGKISCKILEMVGDILCPGLGKVRESPGTFFHIFYGNPVITSESLVCLLILNVITSLP